MCQPITNMSKLFKQIIVGSWIILRLPEEVIFRLREEVVKVRPIPEPDPPKIESSLPAFLCAVCLGGALLAACGRGADSTPPPAPRVAQSQAAPVPPQAPPLPPANELQPPPRSVSAPCVERKWTWVSPLNQRCALRS